MIFLIFYASSLSIGVEDGSAVYLALLASGSALADNASASKRLDYIITAGQRPAVVSCVVIRPRRGRTILQRLT